MVKETVQLLNKSGLHARPANLFVKAAQGFTSAIEVLSKEGRKADGKSIIGILTLGAVKGTWLTIQAEGIDEKEAVHTLVELINEKFDE